MDNNNLLFESIFKRKLSATDTGDYLTQITNEHPYFSPAQFFLLLQAEKGTTAYQQQAAKTSILFNNPYWLQFQLQEMHQSPGEISDTIVAHDKQFVLSGNQQNMSPEIVERNETQHTNKTTNINHPEKEEIIAADDTAPTNKDSLPSQQQEPAIDLSAEKGLEPTLHETGSLHSAQITQGDTGNFTEPLSGENMISDKENNIDKIISAEKIEGSFNEPPFIAEPERDSFAVNKESPVLEAPENEDEIIETLQSGHFNNDNSPLVNESETEDNLLTEKEIEPLNFKLNIDTANTTEDSITFEPLHTSDYFASLGIKLSGEIKPTDKLGKQLKSFTEWLKTMKKIHNDQLPLQSSQSEISIQKLAEQSNKEDAVETEAMAEVLIQQGKMDKAIKVYKKLSLLNPSKSAYFAAKIDQLKEH